MKNKVKISIALMLIMIMQVMPVSAKSGEEGCISPQEGCIIRQDTVYVDGIPVIYTLYQNEGVYAETISIKQSRFSRGTTVDQERLMEKIIAISDERAETIYDFPMNLKKDAVSENSEVGARAYHAWTESKNNSKAGNGAGESKYVYAGHWSEIDYTVLDTAGRMSAYDGASRSLYHGSHKVTEMKITETITKKSLSISVSFPLSFSLTPSKSEATLSATYKGDNNICTQYRENFSASSGLNTGTFVKINTVAQVTLGNDSYSASVSSDW